MTNNPGATGHPKHTNRLSKELSPYLLQHAHNPVDWYPWGAEALERARRENRPILLSVGYAACHWCHVMERESFEDEHIAAFMNEHFVNIKVDREERPDIDALYMDAVQALTGSGGWPMTVFLTPDGAPFYAGTYFPPRDRYGMPSFGRVLATMADYYANRPDEVEQQAQAFRDFYRQRSEGRLKQPTVPSRQEFDGPSILLAATDRLAADFDPVHGGFGRAPKFPHPMGLEFLLRMLSRTGTARLDSEERERVQTLLTRTLDAMADGGMYDQVGGGFHRYSTDARWLVPHFEKMLYDNAQLARVYLAAWQWTGVDRYRAICEETLDYVLREMVGPAGEFYSTQDADSGGVEGKYYVWSLDEVRGLLDEADADIVCAFWGITAEGNFEGNNILHRADTVEAIASRARVSPETVTRAIARARVALHEARRARLAPARDDKVLAAWNGLMLRAFADAGRILNREDYRAAARNNAAFIHDNLIVDGRVRHSWRDGVTSQIGFLDDHGALANGLLSLYEATGDVQYLLEARQVLDQALTWFWSDDTATFYDTAHDHEALVGRPRELSDNAVPSGTSLVTEALIRCGTFYGDDHLRALTERVLLPLAETASEIPLGLSHLLCAMDDFVGPLHEIAIVGVKAREDTRALLQALARTFLPRMVLAYAEPAEVDTTPVPLLQDRTIRDGQAMAYVCQGFACKAPVSDGDALLAEIASSDVA